MEIFVTKRANKEDTGATFCAAAFHVNTIAWQRAGAARTTGEDFWFGYALLQRWAAFTEIAVVEETKRRNVKLCDM